MASNKLFSLEQINEFIRGQNEDGDVIPFSSILFARQLADTMRENLDFREALKMIAKPALGGKLQQQVAQLALKRNKEPENVG